MQELYEQEFAATIKKAIEVFSKKCNEPKTDIHIVFGAKNETGSSVKNIYYVLTKKGTLSVKFKELLNVKIDLSVKSIVVPPFILKSLSRLGQLNNIPIQTIQARMFDDGNGNIRICLYNGDKYVKDLAVSDIMVEPKEDAAEKDDNT